MTLKEKILRYRAKNGLTQQEFADKCGISRYTIIAAENNDKISAISETKIKLVIEEEA